MLQIPKSQAVLVRRMSAVSVGCLPIDFKEGFWRGYLLKQPKAQNVKLNGSSF